MNGFRTGHHLYAMCRRGDGAQCSATSAKLDIGYSLVDNDPQVTRFGFPWRWAGLRERIFL
jgi:hypothetical protein